MTQQLDPHETEEARRRRYVSRGRPVSWMMLLVSTLAILIISADRVILPTLLPAILTAFNLTETQGGVLNSLSFVGTFVGAIVLGVLGDSLGRSLRRARTWMGTVLMTTIGSVGKFSTNTLGGLQLWRVVKVGTGGMEPVNVTMVGEWWQKENRGFAVGMHHKGFPIGQFVGPLLIGAIMRRSSGSSGASRWSSWPSASSTTSSGSRPTS